MITIEAIEELFQHTRNLLKEGKASYNIDDVCRWSYFFLDEDMEKLTRAGRFLEGEGYEIIGFIEPEWEEEEMRFVVLRADRIEKNTVESLVKRSRELYAIAQRFDLSSFDGMDVGAVDGP